MLSTVLITALFAFSTFSGVSAHASHDLRGLTMIRQDPTAPFSAGKFPDVQKALEGNARFQKNRDAAALQSLVDDGQKPPFMMISCSDSRAPEATIFDSQPGTFFMERNIANQYKLGDENAQSVMAYGITVLGVQHVVVLGHYGCGGVAASIASKPKTKIDIATHIVQTWISDVRQLYLQSERTEIVQMREKNLAAEAKGETVPEPEIKDPGFRALVEENVKLGVKRLSESSVISNLHDRLAANPTEEKGKRATEEGAAPLKPVFVHGWVYDLESGTVTDLNVSTGPKGFESFVPGATPETKPKSEEAKPEEAKSTTPSVEENATTTTDAAAGTSTGAAEEKVVGVNPGQELVSEVPGSDVKEIGHSTIPVKRSKMLARLSRSLSQEGSYGKRFSRQS